MSRKTSDSAPDEHADAELIPDVGLGGRPHGVIAVSVANVRRDPRHWAELVTQLLLGTTVALSQSKGGWFEIAAPDGMTGWIEGKELVQTDDAGLAAWTSAPQIIVTAFHDFLWEQPDDKSLPVSDVVTGVILKRVSSNSGWIKTELPDGRTGHLQRHSGTEFATWKRNTRATASNIERVAKSFLGLPYMWGGTSTKGVDCSGFTQTVFRLNGIQIPRDAWQQAAEAGRLVDPGTNFKDLQKGDLIFFSGRSSRTRAEGITHVGIYLENRVFIHSAGRVQFNSFDPASPLFAEDRLKSFHSARRVLNP
jgi:cell wall-associated NlpC family hydrolase